MGSVSVQLGLLAIAKDLANVDHRDVEIAQARATAAGHRIMVQQVVGDREDAIREALTRWIDDPALDVIIVLGGDTSDAASAALRPLVAHVLPGFTDLFRFLSFQETGASAMLASAEAARCKDTFVFVLPGAVGVAMDKLILPQLDPMTMPKNLVSQMPRLRAATDAAREDSGVPQAITAEKTQGGSGVSARLPALSKPTATRAKKHSTGVHVIVRPKPGEFDSVTAPIDLERLEREIAASQGNRDDTIQRMLPRVPPGADDDDETESHEEDRRPGFLVPVTINPRHRGEVAKPLATSPARSKSASADQEPKAAPRTHPPTSPPVRTRQVSTVVPAMNPSKSRFSDEGPTKVRPAVVSPIDETRRAEKFSADAIEVRATPAAEPKIETNFQPKIVGPATPATSASMVLSDEDLETEGIETMDLEPDPTGAVPKISLPPQEPTPPPLERRPTGELPSGTFTYPRQKPSTHPALKVAGLVGIVALGFFAFVFFARTDKPAQIAVQADAAVRVQEVPTDATSVVVVDAPEVGTVDIDAAPEIEMPATRPTPTHTPPTGRRPTGTRPTGADVAASVPGDAAPAPEPVADGCDETSCVLTKYEQACCMKFKPVSSDLSKRENGLPDSLDKLMVRAGVEGVKARVTTCGEKSGVRGKVSVQMTVSPDGVVASAVLDESPDPALGACVVGAMKAAKFGKSAKGGNFTYPFLF